VLLRAIVTVGSLLHFMYQHGKRSYTFFPFHQTQRTQEHQYN
jgi:hypothetical protein